MLRIPGSGSGKRGLGGQLRGDDVMMPSYVYQGKGTCRSCWAVIKHQPLAGHCAKRDCFTWSSSNNLDACCPSHFIVEDTAAQRVSVTHLGNEASK